jgi:hypothetical protein
MELTRVTWESGGAVDALSWCRVSSAGSVAAGVGAGGVLAITNFDGWPGR